MPTLAQPTAAVHLSFLRAMDEFRAEGRGGPADDTMIGREIRQYGSTWNHLNGFSTYLAALLAEANEETPRPEGIVACTTWWWVDGDEYLGRIAARHRLTDRLHAVGGHVGYDVRPRARRRGHATAMLAAALPLVHSLGVDPALVTCDVDNVASRRVVEANGGRVEDERGDERGDKYRFWVPTGR